jgi:hypothetical protein
MGARSSGGLRRYLGSVSAKVAAEADCSVTVVRTPATAPDAATGAAQATSPDTAP